ncbi:MAG: DEAD/DEAH box helicase family protein [Deltaproteobacteria bacterium]|nr:DEAD/DEAH box helicase family protein [Deltaproteobacteria bacterium]
MLPVERLGLSAQSWEFMHSPDCYVHSSKRPLVPESTARQLRTAAEILARLNGSHGKPARRGVLLADDVGLGKTTVAALVAWVVAGAGERGNVRILVPNDAMVRRWEEELLSHVAPLRQCAKHLQVDARRVKATKDVSRLRAGAIQVTKHSAAASIHLACDLLIVDEAHRARGDGTSFSQALRDQRKLAKRVLILTATPFSIEIEELNRMLLLIGGEEAKPAVRAYKNALKDLYDGSTARSPEVVAERLRERAHAAVEAISRFVIRHDVEALRNERSSFGHSQDWPIDVPVAKEDELTLMLRMDRALRLAKAAGMERAGATNDARFHVGWRHFDEERAELSSAMTTLPSTHRDVSVIAHHLNAIGPVRSRVGVHSKMKAVTEAVRAVLKQGEKVLLFCHHIATAQELATQLHAGLPPLRPTRLMPPRGSLAQAWREVLFAEKVEHDDEGDGGASAHDSEDVRAAFIEWLVTDVVRAQTGQWLSETPLGDSLAERISSVKPRSASARETLADAASRLYATLLSSRSARAVLKNAAADGLDGVELLPGGAGSRVFALCEPTDDVKDEVLFSHQREPDTLLAMFNSPFGPDVLVVTDKLSEGIDLHRYCRHLVHYELDPSPIRTVQRNGRLRRVNCWAAVTGDPIRYAYPAFKGTRDHRLVQIMRKRIDSFSLLLGGVQDFDVDKTVGADEKWRNDVIGIARRGLERTGALLRVT